MNVDNILILRLCHDLVTPLSAINLGIDTFEIAEDKTILEDIKESTGKANSMLRYFRELFSSNKVILTNIMAIQELMCDFLNKYKISAKIKYHEKNISEVIGTILLFNGIISKEIMPIGGQVDIVIDESGTISTHCRGMHLVTPIFDLPEYSINYRNIMQYYLKKYTDEHGYFIEVSHSEGMISLFEKTCNPSAN